MHQLREMARGPCHQAVQEEREHQEQHCTGQMEHLEHSKRATQREGHSVSEDSQLIEEANRGGSKVRLEEAQIPVRC